VVRRRNSKAARGAELIIAAIRHHTPATVPPDTGTLRGDVLALLDQMSASVSQMSAGVSEIAGVLTFIFADYVMINQAPVPPATLTEIVDRIFLPLVRP